MSKTKKIALMLVVAMCISFLSGCWDSKELDSLLLVTGIGIDSSQEKEYNITVQVANTQPPSAGGSTGGGSSESTGMATNLTVPSDTVLGGLEEINKNSNRTLLIDHSRILVFGEQIAQQGLTDVLDAIIRTKDARIEVPVVIVQGTAQEVLNTELKQEPFSGFYLANAVEDLTATSKRFAVRIFDFMNQLICSKMASTIPYIIVQENNGNKEFVVDGLAVLTEGKMLDKLNMQETQGFLLTDKKVGKLGLEGKNDQGKAVFKIIKSKCKRDVKVTKDGAVKVGFNIIAEAELGELSGFETLDSVKLVEALNKLLTDTITENVNAVIAKSKLLNADVFGVCEQLYRTKFSFWKEVFEEWETKFQQVEFKVSVKAKLVDTGEIGDTVAIERNIKKEELLNGYR